MARIPRRRPGVPLVSLMAVVAAFALGMWAERMRGRMAYCRDRVDSCRAEEASVLADLRRSEDYLATLRRRLERDRKNGSERGVAFQLASIERVKQELAVKREIAKLHLAVLAEKRAEYERAGSAPWSKIPPDPRAPAPPGL